MKKWVKFGGFSYYSRLLGKSDDFLIMFKKNRKLDKNMNPKECYLDYILTFNQQLKTIEKLQLIYYWLAGNKLLNTFGLVLVENKVYKNERSIHGHSARWFNSRVNLVDKGTLQRWNNVIFLFEEFKKGIK